MSAIIKEVKISYSYQREDGTMAHNLSAVESFRGHTADGRYFVGAYIHTDTVLAAKVVLSICLGFAPLKICFRWQKSSIGIIPLLRLSILKILAVLIPTPRLLLMKSQMTSLSSLNILKTDVKHPFP